MDTIKTGKFLRQYRTKIVRILRSQIFCQIVQIYRRNTNVFQGKFGRYDGKDASKMRTKPIGGLCAVLP